MPAQDVLSIAHEQDAVAILAHPFRGADPFELPLTLFDAIEVDSTSFSGAETELAFRLARKLNKPQVASSDAHALSRLGWAWTEIDTTPKDERELADLIRQGRCRPVFHRKSSIGKELKGPAQSRRAG
jgi:predicted metal-dependent phosphoesterase TrpH